MYSRDRLPCDSHSSRSSHRSASTQPKRAPKPSAALSHHACLCLRQYLRVHLSLAVSTWQLRYAAHVAAGGAAGASGALCARLGDPRVEAAPQAGAPYVVAGTYTHQLPDAKAVEAFEKSL